MDTSQSAIIFRCIWCDKEFVPEMAVMTDCPKSELWMLHNLEMERIRIPDDISAL